MSIEGSMLIKNVETKKTQSIVGIRNLVFVLLALLIAQFWLGMTINLEIDIPVKYLGAVQSLVYFGSHFGFILAHIVVGFTILITSLGLLVLSFRTHILSLRISAVIILAGVIGAIINGILFLMSGQFFGWSIGMAMSAVTVLIVSAISLYYIGQYIHNP